MNGQLAPVVQVPTRKESDEANVVDRHAQCGGIL